MLDFPSDPAADQIYFGSNGVVYQWQDSLGLWMTPSAASTVTGTGAVVLQNSPQLTGTPTSATPPPFDDDSSIATTEYVRNTVGGLSIMEFGAVGNGTTDDTNAFKAAAATGKTIYVPVPSVHYQITAGSIECVDGTEFVGLGNRKAKIKMHTDSITGVFMVGRNTAPYTPAHNVAFRNLWLVGNGYKAVGVTSFSQAIYAYGGSDILIDNCLIEDWTYFGIILDGCTRATVSNNVVRNIHRRSGISCGVTAASFDIKVLNNHVSYCQEANIVGRVNGWIVDGNFCDVTNWHPGEGWGISDNITGYSEFTNAVATDALKYIITNNVCRNSGNNGMHVGCENVLISGNIVENSTIGGITVSRAPNHGFYTNPTPPPATIEKWPDQGYDVIISNNEISFANNTGPGRYGLGLTHISRFNISGNVIRRCLRGMRLVGYAGQGSVTSGSITGNSITNTSNCGIDLSGDIANIAIDGNVIEKGNPDSPDLSVPPPTVYIGDFYHNAEDTTLIGPSNVSVGGTPRISRLIMTSSDTNDSAYASIKATGTDPNIRIALVPTGTGVVQANVFSNAAATLTGITIHDLSNSGGWPINEIGAGLNFSSADTGYPAQTGVRLSFGMAMSSASGNFSNFVWSTAPVTAGTMVPVMVLDAVGNLALNSTIASVQGLAKFVITGDIDRATWGSTSGVLLAVFPSIVRETSTGAGGTVAVRFANSFGAPTFSHLNTGVTITTAATLFIGGVPLAGTNTTITNGYSIYANGTSYLQAVFTSASTASFVPLRVPHGVAPTTPTNGDIWTTSAGLYVRINGVTVGPLT